VLVPVCFLEWGFVFTGRGVLFFCSTVCYVGGVGDVLVYWGGVWWGGGGPAARAGEGKEPEGAAGPWGAEEGRSGVDP